MNDREDAIRNYVLLETNRFYGTVITITDPVICNDGTTFEDYSWEQHLKYLGFGVEKDE